MRTIIFDFDGTIADSFDFVLDFLVQQSGKQPMPEMADRQKFRRLSMIGIARQLGISWVKLPWLLIAGRREMARSMPNVKPVDGMLELLKNLNTNRYQLMILSTNTSRTIRAFLKHYDLNDHFVKIVGNVGVFGKAPALRRIMKSARVKPEDCIYIGDEVRDIEASSSIGIDCIAVSWGFADMRFLSAASPLAVAETPSELQTLISNLKDL